MTSDAALSEVFVWIWLPGAAAPVVAGRLARAGDRLLFNYGQSYLARANAVSIYEPELPLRVGALPLPAGLLIPGSLRDAAPDAWGRRVILNRIMGREAIDTDALDELTFLLESGSDRVGALDFQASPSTYLPRDQGPASLHDLMEAADRIERRVALTPDLSQALLHGSSIGGARPKAVIVDGEHEYIAKFSSQNDFYPVVKAEYVAMRLAKIVGLNVPPVKLTNVLGKDVLLVERFDRQRVAEGWLRRAMVSALTMLELDELLARYASYEDLAILIRRRFSAPRETLRELFGRVVFNILCGNTDDHARNHAAYWDGRQLSLTPAYDICPQPRAGDEASQAMLIAGSNRESRLSVCIEAAGIFQLNKEQAVSLIAAQISVIRERWIDICGEAGLSTAEQSLFWRRQFLNPYSLQGAPAELGDLSQT